MLLLETMGRVAVVAPHPDDEVLGCGGTIARLTAAGSEVHVVTATQGQAPHFDPAGVAQVAEEQRAAHRLLGVIHSHSVPLPAARLDSLAQADVNAALGTILDQIAPDTLLLPFHGDIHHDHRVVFTAAMVWARPRRTGLPTRIWAYETLSETNWYAPPVTPAFIPNCFVDITDTLDTKLAAFACFDSQMKAPPDERSLESIRALATMRGATVYRQSAEAFMNVREIV